MIVDRNIRFGRLVAIIWKRVVLMTVVSSLIVAVIAWLDLSKVVPDITAPLILGTALAIFLGFRTDTANERWFGARRMFYTLAAQSRTLGLVVAQSLARHARDDTPSLRPKDRAAMERLVRLSMAHAWCLGRQLKGHDPLVHPDVLNLLTEAERDALSRSHNPALAIVFDQTQALGRLTDTGALTDPEADELADILREVARVQTEAEGLRDTPFPVHYSIFTHVFIWLLVVLLSLSLPAKEQLAVYAVPLAVLIGWIFSMIEGIGSYMEEPWADNRNVVPTDAIARNLERDLRALTLGETDLPDALTPEGGALY